MNQTSWPYDFFFFVSFSPVVLVHGVTDYIRKFFSPGFRKQEAESATNECKAAINCGRYSKMVPRQQGKRWSQNATYSAHDNGQTNGCLPTTET